MAWTSTFTIETSPFLLARIISTGPTRSTVVDVPISPTITMVDIANFAARQEEHEQAKDDAAAALTPGPIVSAKIPDPVPPDLTQDQVNLLNYQGALNNLQQVQLLLDSGAPVDQTIVDAAKQVAADTFAKVSDTVITKPLPDQVVIVKGVK